MRNRWGQEKGMGRERGGGRSVYKQPETRVDRDRTTRKEGFQVSKRPGRKTSAIVCNLLPDVACGPS